MSPTSNAGPAMLGVVIGLVLPFAMRAVARTIRGTKLESVLTKPRYSRMLPRIDTPYMTREELLQSARWFLFFTFGSFGLLIVCVAFGLVFRHPTVGIEFPSDWFAILSVFAGEAVIAGVAAALYLFIRALLRNPHYRPPAPVPPRERRARAA
jgi:hypothetical protein